MLSGHLGTPNGVIYVIGMPKKPSKRLDSAVLTAEADRIDQAAWSECAAGSAVTFQGEKFLDAVDRMIGDAGQYVAQVTFGVQSV